MQQHRNPPPKPKQAKRLKREELSQQQRPEPVFPEPEAPPWKPMG